MQVMPVAAAASSELPTYGPYSPTSKMMFDVCATLDSHRNPRTVDTARLKRDTLLLISAFKIKIVRLPGEHLLFTLVTIAVLLKKLNRESDFFKLLCQLVYDDLFTNETTTRFQNLYQNTIKWAQESTATSIQSLFDAACQLQSSEERGYCMPLQLQNCDAVPEIHPLRLLSTTKKTTPLFDFYALCYWLHVILPTEFSGIEHLVAPVASWINETARDPVKIIYTLSLLSFFELFRRQSFIHRLSKLSVTTPNVEPEVNSWLQRDQAHTLLRELLINEHVVDSPLVLTLLETKYALKYREKDLAWLSKCDAFDARVLINLIDAKSVTLEQILTFHQIIINASNTSNLDFGCRLEIATSIIKRCSTEQLFLTRSDGGVCLLTLFLSLLLLKTEAETEKCLEACQERIEKMIDYLCKAQWRLDRSESTQHQYYVHLANRIKETVQAVAAYKTTEIYTCCIRAFHAAIRQTPASRGPAYDALHQAMRELYERIPEGQRKPEIREYFVQLA